MAERKKILVVDDSPFEVEALHRVLWNNGYEVTTASVGEIALNKIKAEKTRCGYFRCHYAGYGWYSRMSKNKRQSGY